jgi:hypothetical protein
MPTARVENLYLAVQCVPSIEPLAALAAPSSFTTKCSEIFKTVKKGRLGYGLCHEKLNPTQYCQRFSPLNCTIRM